MLDAKPAAGRTSPTCQYKTKGAFHKRHAVFFERKKMIQGHGKVVQVRDERPVRIAADFAVTPPNKPFDS